MRDLQQWSRDSPLRNDWYDFAADHEVIGKTKADNIQSQFSGGGNSSCLQKVLKLWFDSTPESDHNWQVINDALEGMGERRVIEAIEEKYLMW